MKRARWKLRMRSIMVLSSLLLILLYAVLIGTQFYRSSWDYLQRVYSSQGRDTLTYTSLALEDDLLRLQYAAAELRHNTAFAQQLAEYDGGDIRSKLEAQEALSSMLAMLQIMNKNISALAVFTDASVFCTGDVSMHEISARGFLSLFVPGGAGEEPVLFAPVLPPAKEYRQQTDSLELLRHRFFIMVPFRTERSVSILCVILHKEYLGELLSDMENIAVLRADGTVLYNATSRTDEALTADVHERNAGVPVTALAEPGDIRLIYTGVEELLEAQMARILTFMLSFYSLVLAVSLLVAGRFARRITVPINQLMERMDHRRILSEPQQKPLPPGKSLSLRESVMYYLFAVVLISSALISVISVSFFSRFLETAATDLLRGSFEHAYKNTQSLTGNLLSTTRYLSYEDDTQAVLLSAADGEAADPDDISRILTDKKLFRYDAAVGLYDAGGRPVYLSDIYLLPSVWQEGAFSSSPSWDVAVSGRSRHLIMLSNTIYERYSAARDGIGYIVVLTDETVFEDQYEHLLSQQCQAVLCTRDGRIVSHPNKNLIGTLWEPVYSPAGALTMTAPIEKTPFQLTVLFDQAIIEAERTSFLVSIVYLFVILIMVLLLSSILIAYILGKSFQRFSQRMAETGAAPLAVQSASDSVVWEISQLFTLFNEMSEQIRRCTVEMLEANRCRHELELARNTAQYQMLQAQINPHFLYNTFESISFMIRRGDKDEAIDMLCELSDMLRFAARQDETVIPLSEELSYTEKFIRIMQARYGGAIEFDIRFDDSSKGLYTPKFFLQPLVENAIRHGVRPCGGGLVQITGTVAGDKLIIVVRDNGAGIPPERLREVTGLLSADDRGGSIGLSNIQRRIRSMYGEPYGLYIMSEPGMGTSVTVMLPVVRRQDGNAPPLPRP